MLLSASTHYIKSNKIFSSSKWSQCKNGQQSKENSKHSFEIGILVCENRIFTTISTKWLENKSSAESFCDLKVVPNIYVFSYFCKFEYFMNMNKNRLRLNVHSPPNAVKRILWPLTRQPSARNRPTIFDVWKSITFLVVSFQFRTKFVEEENRTSPWQMWNASVVDPPLNNP